MAVQERLESLTDFDRAESNHGTIDLIHGSIDLFEIIRVGNDLVTSDDILELESMISNDPKGQDFGAGKAHRLNQPCK